MSPTTTTAAPPRVPRRQSGQQLAGTTLSQETRPGVKLAPGYSQQFGPDGKPIGFARTGSMKLAPGMQVTYDAQGRASFSKIPAKPATPAPAAPAAEDTAPLPFDAEAGSSIARTLYETERQRAQVEQQAREDQQDHDQTLARMGVARKDDLLGANSDANRSGLIYSTTLGKRRGGIERDYGERESDARLAFDRRAAARAEALKDIGTITADPNAPGGYVATGRAGLDLSDIAVGAVNRRINANQDAPVADPGVTVPPPQADPGAAAPAGGAKKKSYVKNGWFYREGPDGKMLRIRRAS